MLNMRKFFYLKSTRKLVLMSSVLKIFYFIYFWNFEELNFIENLFNSWNIMRGVLTGHMLG